MAEQSVTYRVARRAYSRTLRPYLPRKLGVLNGAVVRRPRLFDLTDVDPDYKSALIEPLRSHVSEGDTVVNIGGGSGVSTVVAATIVGERGRVVCYEGSAEWFERCEEAADLNGVSDRVEFVHGVVGEDVNVWGQPGDHVEPGDLPPCDCLVMDCEGAEWSILSALEQTPAVLSVEAHPHLGVSASTVCNWMDAHEYDYQVSRNGGVGYEPGGGNPVVQARRPEVSEHA